MAKATINDFLDVVRYGSDEAIRSLEQQVIVIKRKAAAKGLLQSGATIRALLDAGEAAYRSRAEAVIDTMRRRSHDLDPTDVRDMGFQHLMELIDKIRGALGLLGVQIGGVDAVVEQRFASIREYLKFVARQYAIGWAGSPPRGSEGALAIDGPSPVVSPAAKFLADPSSPATKTVFISYSWDSEAHKTWVRELATRLRTNGVEAVLDQWDIHPGQSVTQFMDERLPKADFVVVVCTPAYSLKANQRQGGVGYEAQIISAHVAAGVERKRFVPIVRAGSLSPVEQNCALPTHFQGIMYIDMRDDDNFAVMFESLLRHIFGKPALTPPPLGTPPNFS